MRTHHISVFGVATMVLILIATGLATRLSELALASAMRLTSVGGGGMISPEDLASGDTRRVGWALVRLLLPGILIQALLVRIVVGSFRGLTIPFVATAAVLAISIADMHTSAIAPAASKNRHGTPARRVSGRAYA